MIRFTSFFKKQGLRRCDPVKLVSWNHVAHICNLFAAKDIGCEFFKSYRRAAYKSLPVCPIQTKPAVVVLKNPSGGKRYAFARRTLLFGSLSSVLHYNITPRAIAGLAGAMVGIPLVFFFGDFGAIFLKLLAAYGLCFFGQFCEICGFDLKAVKAEICQNVGFLGDKGSFSTKANRFS